MTKQQSIGREKAIELANSGWWKGMEYRDIAKFQLFTEELAMPFNVFHEALEKSLGRPVWTHELARVESLMLEFMGEKDPPTFQEIMDIIPESKRIIVVAQ
jgi:hypothetical protein